MFKTANNLVPEYLSDKFTSVNTIHRHNLRGDLGGNRTHDLQIRSTVTLQTELRGRTEKVGDGFRW